MVWSALSHCCLITTSGVQRTTRCWCQGWQQGPSKPSWSSNLGCGSCSSGCSIGRHILANASTVKGSSCLTMSMQTQSRPGPGRIFFDCSVITVELPLSTSFVLLLLNTSRVGAQCTLANWIRLYRTGCPYASSTPAPKTAGASKVRQITALFVLQECF